MADTLKPRDETEVREAVQWLLAQKKSLEIIGHGTKRAVGRPAQVDATLDLSALSKVTLYEPEELVLSAKAGTPISDIAALLAGSRQELAFEPADYGALLGRAPGAGTIGGVLAANLSGPRRVRAGAARDHFLGFAAVSGRGETFKSGGRVVKNVTGYDLCKLMAGSWGTLAALTNVTLKTLPKAETEATLLVFGLDDAQAIRALAAAMASPCEVSGAAHLPAAVAGRALDEMPDDGVTALRLEGVAPSVDHRRRTLTGLMKPFGALAVLEEARSRALWRAIRDVLPFAPQPLPKEEDRFTGDQGRIEPNASAARSDWRGEGTVSGDRCVWRISTAPSHGAELARRIGSEADAEFLYDWAGGLVWAAIAPCDDAGAAIVRQAVACYGGHATLIRAPADVRAAVAAFEPQSGALAALTKRIKESFDPMGIFNPGRMWTGV